MNNTNQITSELERNNISENFIIFNLQEKKYAINLQNIVEIITLPELEIPTKTPIGIIGIFNYNGQMIKAVDLSPFVGFEPATLKIKNQLIIVKVNDELFAILIDNVEEIKNIKEKNLQSLPYEIKNQIISNICKTDKDTISLINLNKIIENLYADIQDENHHNYLSLLPKDYKSKQILNLRAQRYNIIDDTVNSVFDVQKDRQYILFTIDNYNYYIELKYVKEFVSSKRLKITKLPYTQDFIKGIINLNGDFLVVVDLKRFLNNEVTTLTYKHKLIIAEAKGFNIALLVDDIKGIKVIENIDEVKNNYNNDGYILTEFNFEDTVYNVLNFEKVINDERLFININ